jgi:hypothetical protein
MRVVRLASTLPARRSRVVAPLVAVLAVLIVGNVACVPPSDIAGEPVVTEVATRVVDGAVADDDGAFVVVGDLIGGGGALIAFDPAGAERWRTEFDGRGRAPVLGRDGLVYVGTTNATVAFTRDGESTSYRGAVGGELAWHPSGGVLVFGGAISLLDDTGAVVRRFSDANVWSAAAIDADGNVYAVGSPVGTAATTLLALTVDLDERWRADLGPQRPVTVAVDDARVIAQLGDGNVFALAHDGRGLWGVTGSAATGLLIDDDGTVIIGNGTIDEDGKPTTWPTSGLFTIVGGVLAGYGGVEDEVLGIDWHLGTFDKKSATPIRSAPVLPVQEHFPTANRGAVFGAGQFIEQASFIDDTGISAQQTAHAFVHVLPGPLDDAGPTKAPWPTTRGDGGRRALPARDVLPRVEGLTGLWVAEDGFHARVLEFADRATAFDLSEPAYGLYDYDVRNEVRLVQVGTWTTSSTGNGATVTLHPTSDLTGGTGRTTLTLHEGTPGQLRIDDPLEDAVHVFRRRAALPTPTTGVGAPDLDVRYARGALDADSVVFTAPANDDDVWVLSAFDFLGLIGDTTLAVEVIRDPVTGENTFGGGVALWRLGTDRVKNLMQFGGNGVDNDGGNGATGSIVGMRARGDRVRLLGAISPDRNSPRYGWVEYAPAGDTLEVVDHGAVVDDDMLTDFTRFPAAVFADGGFVDVRDVTDGVALTGIDGNGATAWTRVLPHEAGHVFVQGVAALDDDTVGFLGDRTGTLVVDDVRLRLGPARASFVLAFDRRTGAAVGGRALGGRLEPGGLTGAPGGRVVVGGVVVDRFTAGGPLVVDPGANAPAVLAVLQGPGQDFALVAQRELPPLTEPFGPKDALFHTVTTTPNGVIVMAGQWLTPVTLEQGRPVVNVAANSTVEAFDPCARSLWRRTTPVLDGRFVHRADGHLLFGGGFMGDFFEDGRAFAFSGGFPDPSTGGGGTDAIVIEVNTDDDVLGGAPASCATPAKPAEGIVTVSLRGLGAGRVTSDPPGLDCPGTCSAFFPMLTEVTLHAAPADGASLDGFVGVNDLDGDTAYVRVVGDVTVGVGFANTRVHTTFAGPTVRLLRPDANPADEDGALVVVQANEAGGLPLPDGASGPQVLRVRPGVGVATVFTPNGAAGFADVADVVALPDGAVAVLAGGRVVVFDVDGGERFVLTLPDGGFGGGGNLAVTRSGALVVVWPANQPTTVDGLVLDPDAGLLALLSPVDGRVQRAVALGALPQNYGAASNQLRANDLGGVDLVGSAFGLPSTTVVPGATLVPGSTGPWAVRLDDELNLVRFAQWPGEAPWAPSFADLGSTQVVAVAFDEARSAGVDDALVPSWAGVVPGNGFPAVVPVDPVHLLGGLGANVFPDLVVDPAARDLALVGIDPSATPVTVWATRTGDVRVDAAVVVDGGVWAVVNGIVRDELGAPLPDFATNTPALVFLQRSEVRR